ncbi:hypothetical protein [Deinococcus xianganensis]|uniref:Uncharacterized protein n=1 Tax=Deinococcus xianganensis TaxID=1507289 RepID=A0A6I4YLY1_9DEIO|nr:hypothetical protein [Deinococcus xianganensis]MXV18595.1 hypothetical protein [Deinococcus xianganensis]
MDDLDAGVVTLEGDTYGQHQEQDAVSAVLPELREVGALVVFRGHAVTATLFAGIGAQVESLEA